MNKIVKDLIERHIEEIENGNYDAVVYEAHEKNIYEEFVRVLNTAELKCVEMPRDFNIDTALMPNYLNGAHFIKWMRKFKQMCDNLSLPARSLEKLKIVFSLEEKKQTHGFLSIEALKELIKTTWGTNEEIDEILERIHSKEDYSRMIEQLGANIKRLYGEEADFNVEYLYEYLHKLEFEVPLLGEYYNREKLIVLYVVNIENEAKINGHAPVFEFESVFIHELFHAYHYAYDESELVCRLDYTSSVVKESLAAAFQWKYCVEYKIKGADNLRKSWERNSVLTYPYSGALFLVRVDLRTGYYKFDENVFCKIFTNSLNNMDCALRDLVPSNWFYMIKNLILVEKKKVATPVKANTRAVFDALMRGKRVGEIAREEIPPIVASKPYLVIDLLDPAYCDYKLNVSAPVLSTAQVYYKCGTPKYYASVNVTVAGNTYLLFMHWAERHRQALLDWIWENK